MKFSFAIVLSVLGTGSVDATSIKMDFLPIGHVRTDPIISQTCLSDHVHTFYGAQAVRPETDYDALINTNVNQNTGNVEENKSLYWHPTVYQYDQNFSKYTRDSIAQTSAYYIWENDATVKAFPNGFKMIAGLEGNSGGDFPNAVAECVGASNCQRDDCYTENTFFPRQACQELEVSMTFPMCWDGRLDSNDHTSHVAYTTDGELDGSCPHTHPSRLPQVKFFFRILNYNGGWHTFSDGSSIFHADYVSGWDANFLQEVLDNCETDSFDANPHSFCDEFVTFRDGPKCKDENACDASDPALLQKLQNIQPHPLDVTTVTTEESNIVVGNLPKGTCAGALLRPGGGPTTVAVTSPTDAPVTVSGVSPLLLRRNILGKIALASVMITFSIVK